MTYCLASWLHTLFTPLRVFCSIADLDRPPHFFSFRSSLPGWSAASYSSGNFCRKKLAGLEKQLLHYSQVDPRRWQLIRKAHWACRLGQACLLGVSQIEEKLAGLEKQLLHYSHVDPRRWQLIRKAHWACRLGQACLLGVSQIEEKLAGLEKQLLHYSQWRW